jgi:hypothetical protein
VDLRVRAEISSFETTATGTGIGDAEGWDIGIGMKVAPVAVEGFVEISEDSENVGTIEGGDGSKEGDAGINGDAERCDVAFLLSCAALLEFSNDGEAEVIAGDFCFRCLLPSEPSSWRRLFGSVATRWIGTGQRGLTSSNRYSVVKG